MMDRNAEELPAIKDSAQMTQAGLEYLSPETLKRCWIHPTAAGVVFLSHLFSSLCCLFKDALNAASTGSRLPHSAVGQNQPPHSGAGAQCAGKVLARKEIKMIIRSDGTLSNSKRTLCISILICLNRIQELKKIEIFPFIYLQLLYCRVITVLV